jgi:hypothetical protein
MYIIILQNNIKENFMRKCKTRQDNTINLLSINNNFLDGQFKFSKNDDKPHSGIYMIIINNKIYIGESFDLQRRWQEHKQDLINNCHSNYMLQQEFNINKNFDNVYFIPIYHCAFIYATNMVYNEAYNALKLILIIIEHLLIKYFRNNNNFICCNYENTLSKIYRQCNKYDKQYIKQCYNIILQILDNYDKNKIQDNILPYKVNNSIIGLIVNCINGKYDKNSNIINIINNIPILDYKDYKSDNIKDYYTMSPS